MNKKQKKIMNLINTLSPVIIIITGISASGKTTLANKMKNTLGYKILSVDDYKVDVYEHFGFKNDYERQILRNMAVCHFQADLIHLLRSSQNIIVEYPFDKTWQEFFDTVTRDYDYKRIIINCNTRTFEDIWQSRINRDSDSTKRPLCLTASAYIKGELYEPNGKLCDDYKALKSKEYTNNTSGKYTSLTGDSVFTDAEINQVLSETGKA